MQGRAGTELVATADMRRLPGRAGDVVVEEDRASVVVGEHEVCEAGGGFIGGGGGGGPPLVTLKYPSDEDGRFEI